MYFLKKSTKIINFIQKRLTNYWTGKRINMLINTYNQMSTKLYDGVVYFQETILGVLGEIYEQYAAMEKGQPYDVKVTEQYNEKDAKRASSTSK